MTSCCRGLSFVPRSLNSLNEQNVMFGVAVEIGYVCYFAARGPYLEKLCPRCFVRVEAVSNAEGIVLLNVVVWYFQKLKRVSLFSKDRFFLY